MRHTLPAFEFRRRARAAMKPVMPILLVVALIAALPSLIQSAVTLMTNASPDVLITNFSNRLMQVMENPSLSEAQMTEAIAAVTDAYYVEALTFAKEKGPLIAAMALVVALISPMLSLGMINAMLHALRKQNFTPAIAVSRVRYLLKALGLGLLVGLKTLLWTLPGMALMLSSLFLPEELSAFVMIAGMILSLVLGIMAGYRYALANFVMADVPATRIRGCIRRSCEVMKGRKMELFSLEISFLGWSLLLTFVQSMLLEMLGSVIGMALGLFASLFLTVYTSCAQAAFYQEYAVGPLEAPEAPDAAEDPDVEA